MQLSKLCLCEVDTRFALTFSIFLNYTNSASAKYRDFCRKQQYLHALMFFDPHRTARFPVSYEFLWLGDFVPYVHVVWSSAAC